MTVGGADEEGAVKRGGVAEAGEVPLSSARSRAIGVGTGERATLEGVSAEGTVARWIGRSAGGVGRAVAPTAASPSVDVPCGILSASVPGVESPGREKGFPPTSSRGGPKSSAETFAEPSSLTTRRGGEAAALPSIVGDSTEASAG
jgi:hypothetical protein